MISLLFPDGLPGYDNDHSHLNHVLVNAREISQGSLHLSDIEPTRGNGGIDFVGFSCLHAPMRPSSKRVVNEIRKSGTQVCMLTGDGIEAAFSIAEQAAFFGNRGARKSAVLKIVDSVDRQDSGPKIYVG